jgi:CcmD family protein
MIDPIVSMKYMLAGYTVIFSILAAYVASLFVRWKNLKRDLQVMKDIQEQK